MGTGSAKVVLGGEVFFDKEGTEVPLPPCGGQGQVMRARERVGLSGMACALGSPGVQGSLAVTLNQNRRLPFERREEGRTNKHQGRQRCLAWPIHSAETPIHLHHCAYVCVSERKVEVVLLFLLSLIYCTHISLSQTAFLLSFMYNLFSFCQSVSPSVCLSVRLQLLSEFGLTALRQIQIYGLRNEAGPSPSMACFAPVAPKQSEWPVFYSLHSPCSSTFYHHP